MLLCPKRRAAVICLSLASESLTGCIQAYHVSGHAITDEEDDVLGLSLGLKLANGPLGGGLLAVIVVQRNGVCAGLVERDLAVNLGRNVDNARLVRVLSKEILEPLELPGLDLGLLDVKGLCEVLGLLALLGDGHLELLVGLAIMSSLGAVDGSVDLDTEVEELAGEEVTLVWGQNTTERGTCAQALVGLRRNGGKRGREGGNGVELNHGDEAEPSLKSN